MTGVRAHAGIKPHVFDAEFVVPPNHFYNVTNICQAQLLDIPLSPGDIRRLAFVRPIRYGIFRLGGLPEGIAMIDQ